MNETFVPKKYPLVCKILFLLIHLFTPFYMACYMCLSGKVTVTQYAMVICQPLVLIYSIIYLAISLTNSFSMFKIVRMYDGSEKSAVTSNKCYKSISIAAIGTVIINSVIYPIIFCYGCQKLGITGVDLPAYMMNWIGSSLMWGMLWYLLWMKRTDEFLYFLPFERKNIILTLTLKFILVALFSTIAFFMLSTEPFFVAANENVPLKTVFFSQSLFSGLNGIVVITLDFFILGKISIGQLKKINSFTAAVSEGDYTKEPLKVEVRDEIGIITQGMNKFQEETRELLVDLGKTVNISSEAAELTSTAMSEISAATTQIVNNIQEVQDQMSNQSSGVEEAAGAINQILGNIKGLGSTIESQTAAVEESSAAVRQMVANIQSVTSILERNEVSTNQLVNASAEGQKSVLEAVELSEKIIAESSGLLEASNVIQNIASQTNLLAMNAAIEAAHAGESGKGFAVVADEIRNLAEQSNKQGKAITNSLKDLEAVIEGVAASIKKLKVAFDNIYELTNVVTQQEQVIKNAMEEQSEGSNQVLLAIKAIDDSTLEVRQGSEEMVAGSNQVAKEMELLAASTMETSNYVNEMSSGASAIIEAVEKGNHASERNNDSVKLLTDEMNKFKL